MISAKFKMFCFASDANHVVVAKYKPTNDKYVPPTPIYEQSMARNNLWFQYASINFLYKL